MKKLFLQIALSLSLFNSTAMAANDPRVNEILSKHQEAMGGLTNWNRVESIQLNGTVERDGQKVDVVIIKKRPNQIRATVTLPVPGKEDEALQLIRSHDGKAAWTATRIAGDREMTKEKLSEEAAAELLADAGVLPKLIKLWHDGADLKLLNSKTIDGTTCYVIEATGKANKYTFYISRETHLLTHYESDHPENGNTVTRLSEYNSDHGVLIPTLNVIQGDKTGKSVITTTSIKIGVGIYGEYFSAKAQTNDF